MKKPWFKAKQYGWGWYPATWQGWLVIAAWVGFFVLLLRGLDTAGPLSNALTSYFLPLGVSVVVLIAVCWRTGERPSWRWGDREVPAFTVIMKTAIVVGFAFAIVGLIGFLSSR